MHLNIFGDRLNTVRALLDGGAGAAIKDGEGRSVLEMYEQGEFDAEILELIMQALVDGGESS